MALQRGCGKIALPMEAPKGCNTDTPASHQVRPLRERLDWVVRRVMEADEDTRAELNRMTINIELISGEFSYNNNSSVI